VAIVVVAAAGFGAWRAFGPRRTPLPPAGPAGTPNGYFLSDPDITSRYGDVGVHVTMFADTNLPDGTMVLWKWELRPNGGGGGGVNAVVQDGAVRETFDESLCNDLGSGFELTLEVRPFYEDWIVPGYPQGSPWPPTQPDSVLQALGDRFQDLTGDQVTTAESSQGPINQIVVTATYDWPPGSSGSFPPPCPSP
jgi:hypothetical protein